MKSYPPPQFVQTLNEKFLDVFSGSVRTPVALTSSVGNAGTTATLPSSLTSSGPTEGKLSCE